MVTHGKWRWGCEVSGDRVRERISIPFYTFQYHFVYFKMWMYCFGKEKARVKREDSDCDCILNKTRYLSCWFSVFSEARKELRNDLPIYCRSFVLEYKSLRQACHRKEETLAVDMFLEFSSPVSHMMCPVSDTDAWKPEAFNCLGCGQSLCERPLTPASAPLPSLEDVGEFS